MRGGKRSGAGRKTKSEETKVANIAMDAIKSKHGSLELGFAWLLSSNEASLIKFAFEHAFGKPTEKIEHSGEMGIIWMEKKVYESEQKANEGD